MKTIKFIPEFYDLIKTGHKSSTLRKTTFKEFTPGEIVSMTTLEGEQLAEVMIIGQSVVSLKDIIGNEGLAAAEGFSSSKELVEKIKEIYPNEKYFKHVLWCGLVPEGFKDES